MMSYKQWSAATRLARLAEYKTARAAGRIPPPGPCEICGETKGTVHHAEDYGPTLEAYFAALHSVCRRCHAMLHRRSTQPRRFAHVSPCMVMLLMLAVVVLGLVFNTRRRARAAERQRMAARLDQLAL